MLLHPTLDKLHALGLHGMAQALEDQRQLPDIGTLGFEERLGLLVDREATVGRPIPQLLAIWRWLSPHPHLRRSTSFTLRMVNLAAGITTSF